MKDEDLYIGFAPEKQQAYEEYLITEHGDVAMTLIAESKQKTKHWKKSDWKNVKAEGDELHKALVQTIEKNLSPDSPKVQEIIQKHYQMIERFYTPTKDVYTNLGQLYCNQPDFRKLFDSYHPKLAGFLAKAMKIFANQRL